MKASEIANKYGGKSVRCRITKSTPVAGVGEYFDAKVVGWKRAEGNDPEFVLVQVMPPGTTNYTLAKFVKGCVFTGGVVDKSAFGKRLYAEEVIIPAGTSIVIADWPHKCKDCGSPAQILFHAIDCSSPKCKNKFSAKSGMDLFLPKNMRPEVIKAPTIVPKPKSKLIAKTSRA